MVGSEEISPESLQTQVTKQENISTKLEPKNNLYVVGLILFLPLLNCIAWPLLFLLNKICIPLFRSLYRILLLNVGRENVKVPMFWH